MNNTRLKFYFKILIFTALFFVSCGFQTSFWPNVITFIPSPQIWLIMIIFMTVSWRPLFTIFYIYFLGYCVTRFSEIPLKMIWCSLIVTYSAIWFVKNRIQLSGAFSFIVLTLFGSFIFEMSYYNFSDFLETTPTSFMFIDRMLQILVNFIFSYPLYFVFYKLDNVLFDENEWKHSPSDNQEISHE